jgi:hypothetical protein
MRAPQPDPEQAQPSAHEIVQFRSEAEFRTWAQENVADWEQFVDGSLASMAELRAWREAGNSGFPPGWVRFRDYVREHPI